MTDVQRVYAALKKLSNQARTAWGNCSAPPDDEYSEDIEFALLYGEIWTWADKMRERMRREGFVPWKAAGE